MNKAGDLKRSLELLQAKRFDDAERCLQLIIRQYPDDYVAPANLAAMYHNLGKDKDAEKWIERAVNLSRGRNGEPWVQYIHSQILLKAGEWEQGWFKYEYRFAAWNRPPQASVDTLWFGEHLGSNECLSVWNEQGLGDQIMMVRFLKEAKEKSGAWLRLVVDPALVKLFKPMADEVDSRVELLPGEKHCPLFSLSRILDITPDKVSGKPYLPIQWKPSERKRLRVGLCYKGSGRDGLEDRNLDQESIDRLRAYTDVGWVPLQYGDDGFLPEDFYETAQALLDVDCLVTTDTAMVHLAGAMGVPTLLLVRFQGDFRWMQEPSSTVWYDSVKLLRQKSLGDWTYPVGAALEELGDMVHGTNNYARS